MLYTGSLYPITSSWSRRAITASYALNASGGGSSLYTGSTYPITSSWSRRAITASYALNASAASSLHTGSSYPITSSWSLYSIYGPISTGSLNLINVTKNGNGSSSVFNLGDVTFGDINSLVFLGGITLNKAYDYTLIAGILTLSSPPLVNEEIHVVKFIGAGTSGTSGAIGTNGTSGNSGTSGTSGSSGTSGNSGTSGSSGTSGISGNDAANSGRWYYNSSIATPSDPTNTYFNASSGLISSTTQIGVSINNIDSVDYTAWFSNIKNTFDGGQPVMFQLTELGNPNILGIFEVSGITNNTTYWVFTFSLTTAANGSYTSDRTYTISIINDGKDGSHGTSGSSGNSSAGTSGSSGNGTAGSSGTSGATGTSGSSGNNGSSGSSGASGATGSSGSSGDSGSSGSSGSSGNSGSSGTSGSSGSSGNSGTSGSSGSSGSGGSSGTSGLLNLTGSTTNGVITYNGYGNSATVQSGLRYSDNQLVVTSSIRTNSLTSSFAKFTGYTQFLPVGNKNIPSNTTASYIYNSGSTNDLYFTQYNGPYTTNTTRLRWLESNVYTGILNGGVLTSTPGSTTFNITAGEGLIVTQNATTASAPYPTIKLVTWPSYTNRPITYSGSAKISYVGIDNTGQIIQQTVPWGTNNVNEWDTSINLGVVLTLSGSVSTGVYNSPQISYGYPQKNDDFTRAFGPLKISGHTLQASGSTTLSIKKTGGVAYKEGSNYPYDPNHPSTTNENAINTSKIYRYYISGSTAVINSGVANAGFSVLDNKKYVNLTTGTLTTIGGSGNNHFTIQRIFWIPKSPTNAFIAYYGNGVYSTLVEAENAIDTEPFSEAPNTAANAIFVAYVIMEASATNLTTAGTSYIQQGGLFRSVGGVGASGGSAISNTLAGLSDVSISSPSYGDLLMYGNGTQWNNTKTLHGDYTISGSLKTNNSITAVNLTSSNLKISNLSNNSTGYFLSVDNTTGNVFKTSSGASGSSGTSGTSGNTGSSGTSGQSGTSGSSGTSGQNGSSGSSGNTGSSGTSGAALITGSTYPITSSWSRRAITASYALNATGGGSSLYTGSTYPITASRAITASYALTSAGGGGGSSLYTGSTYPITSSYATYAINVVGSISVLTGTAINWNNPTYEKNISTGETYTFTNVTTGSSIVVILNNTGSNSILATFPNNTKWANSLPPTNILSSATSIYTFVRTRLYVLGSSTENYQ